MSVACSTMIVNSLININERPIGSSLTATEQTYYLGKMNAMLESWSLERLMIPSITQGSLGLTSGLGTYTIGSGGAFNMARPTKIIKAFIRDSASADTDVKVIPYDRYDSIVQKSVAGAYPTYLYYDQAYNAGLGTINLYPLPKSGLTLFIDAWVQLQSFANVSTVLTMPPGYQRAIEANFAIECAPGYKGISQELLIIAKQSKAAIKGVNLPDTIMSIESGVTMRRSGSILTGP